MFEVYDRDGRRLLTAEEAAEHVGLTRVAFLRRVHRGNAPKPVGKAGNVMFFLEEDVKSWARWRSPARG